MANNQISEQELQFRKRARRRLVGAIALVLLMVTVLPMILDDRGVKPTQPEIAISIPSQDGADFASNHELPKLAAPVAPAPLAPPLESATTTPVKSEVPAAQAETPQPEKAADVPAEKPAEKPVVAAKPAVTEKPAAVEKVAEKPAELAPATPEPVAPATVKAAATNKPVAKSGTFFVQIGVFAESPKFKQLEGKLTAKGFHPLREKMETPKGQKIRLRIGPFSTRANAEAALERMKAIDVTGMIVSSK